MTKVNTALVAFESYQLTEFGKQKIQGGTDDQNPPKKEKKEDPPLPPLPINSQNNGDARGASDPIPDLILIP